MSAKTWISVLFVVISFHPVFGEPNDVSVPSVRQWYSNTIQSKSGPFIFPKQIFGALEKRSTAPESRLAIGLLTVDACAKRTANRFGVKPTDSYRGSLEKFRKMTCQIIHECFLLAKAISASTEDAEDHTNEFVKMLIVSLQKDACETGRLNTIDPKLLQWLNRKKSRE